MFKRSVKHSFCFNNFEFFVGCLYNILKKNCYKDFSQLRKVLCILKIFQRKNKTGFEISLCGDFLGFFHPPSISLHSPSLLRIFYFYIKLIVLMIERLESYAMIQRSYSMKQLKISDLFLRSD